MYLYTCLLNLFWKLHFLLIDKLTANILSFKNSKLIKIYVRISNNILYVSQVLLKSFRQNIHPSKFQVRNTIIDNTEYLKRQ